MQVAESSPISSSPGEQLKFTVLPSSSRSLYPSTLGTESLLNVDSNSGCPQFAIKNKDRITDLHYSCMHELYVNLLQVYII